MLSWSVKGCAGKEVGRRPAGKHNWHGSHLVPCLVYALLGLQGSGLPKREPLYLTHDKREHGLSKTLSNHNIKYSIKMKILEMNKLRAHVGVESYECWGRPPTNRRKADFVHPVQNVKDCWAHLVRGWM